MDVFEEESKFFFCFFNQMSVMNFDKCREILEREKEVQISKNRQIQFRHLYALLLNFIDAEKSYHNLGFMSTKKIFLRKDNSLKSMFETVRTELTKLEDGNLSDQTTNSVIAQLIQYLSARIQLIDLGCQKDRNPPELMAQFEDETLSRPRVFAWYKEFLESFEKWENEMYDGVLQDCHTINAAYFCLVSYEKIYLIGTGTKHIKYDELQNQIEVLIESLTFSILHHRFKPIRNILMLECEILQHLFGAHHNLQLWSFIPCIIHLDAASSKLTAWERSLQNKESWKLGFLKSSQLPQLYQWLYRLSKATLNKFSLYFYQVLSQQTTHQDMKNYFSTKYNTDFYLKLQQLQKKSFASCALLLFDPSGLGDWTGPGFQHPARSREHYNLSQYLIMLAHPPFKYDRMVGISKALAERSPEYTLPDKVVSVYNAEDKCSYFISSIDPRITLVAIFDMKKDERDVNVVNYLTDFCSQVRCIKVYQALKASK